MKNIGYAIRCCLLVYAGLNSSAAEANSFKLVNFNGTNYSTKANTLDLSISVEQPQSSSPNDTTKNKQNIKLDAVYINRQQHANDPKSKWQLSQQGRRESMGQDLAQQLSQIPGVSILRTGATISKPIINGLYGARIILLNNGVKHESQQWGNDHAPEIDPYFFQQLSVIKNADAVRYGAEAMGGIVQLEPAPFGTDNFKGQVNLVGNSNGKGGSLNTILEGTKKQFSYRFGITAGKSGNLKTPEYYLGNTGKEDLHANLQLAYKAKNWDFDFRLSQYNSKIGLFTGAHIGSPEDIFARIENDKPFETYDFSYEIKSPRQQVSHQLAKLNAIRYFNESKKLELTYSYQGNKRKEFDLRRVESDDTPMANLHLQTQQLEAIYYHNAVQFGLSGSLQVNNNIAGTGTTPLIPNFDNYGIGSFIKNRHELGKTLLEYGIRYDYKYFDVAGYRYDYNNMDQAGIVPTYLLLDRRHFHNISGSIGIVHSIKANHLFKSHASLAWRAPNANELYADGIHHGTGTYEVGNKDLKSEQGVKWMNSYTAKQGAINLQVDTYAQYIANYIYSSPAVDSVKQTIRGTFPVFQYLQTNALFYGVDAQVNFALGKRWDYLINASLTNAKDVTNDKYLPYIPAYRFSQQVTFHLSENTDNNRYVKLKHTYNAKQQRYEANSDFAAPPAAYHLLDLITSSNIYATDKSKATVLFSVDNILNTKYRDYLDRMRYYSHALGRNFSIRLQYTF